MQSTSDTPSSHSRRVGAQPKRGLWPLLVAERRREAGRTGAQQVVALRESLRRGIDPPGITSADATLLSEPRHGKTNGHFHYVVGPALQKQSAVLLNEAVAADIWQLVGSSLRSTQRSIARAPWMSRLGR